MGHKPDAVPVQPVEPGVIQAGPAEDEQIAGLELQVLNGFLKVALSRRKPLGLESLQWPREVAWLCGLGWAATGAAAGAKMLQKAKEKA